MANENGEVKSVKKVIVDAFIELKETFLAFINAPKALWGIKNCLLSR